MNAVQKLFEADHKYFDLKEINSKEYEKIIAPLRDVESVVRCKDCKHRFDGEHIANCCEELMIITGWLTEIPVDPNGFCHKGERKEGDGE